MVLTDLLAAVSLYYWNTCSHIKMLITIFSGNDEVAVVKASIKFQDGYYHTSIVWHKPSSVSSCYGHP
jgi:hypothetical protein